MRRPASQRSHRSREGEGVEPASHVAQLAAPYGATWSAAHSTQPPSIIACPGSHLMQLLPSSDGALPSSHASQRPPVLEAWRAGQRWQCVPLLSVPAGQTVQLLRSAFRWPRDRSQSLHSAEPYRAYCAGPQSWQTPSCIRCPGLHRTQLLPSSDGALPSPHSLQRPPALEA